VPARDPEEREMLKYWHDDLLASRIVLENLYYFYGLQPGLIMELLRQQAQDPANQPGMETCTAISIITC